jgi:ubiquinone/menaquinone biosynthesis C-methylase UbiE
MAVKFDPSRKDRLLSKDRPSSLDTHRLLSLLPIMTYHHVADVGCGPGYITIHLGKFLFDGKVFALDVQQEMLDATQESLEALRLTNVELLLYEEAKLPLEDESLDGAVAAFVLEEAESPETLLKELHRCVKKAGWLALLEWHKSASQEGPPMEQRIEQDKLRDMAEEAGFRFRGSHALNENQYMLIMAV